MIDNDYVFEISEILDTEKLLTIALNAKNDVTLKKHQFDINQDPYLQDIQKKFPILGRTWNFYSFLPYQGIDPHIDARRTCALNIPLKGSENSLTTFYHPEDNMEKEYSDRGVLYYIKKPLEIAYQFTLTKPALIKTSVPHSVRAGFSPRSIISWGIHELDFSQSKKFFQSMSVL